MTSGFRIVISISALVSGLLVLNGQAVEVNSFDQARRQSGETGKPILLQFYHDDCEYCDQAARDAETNTSIKQAFAKVVLLKLSVLQEEGSTLRATYHVGDYFPLFILTDSAGGPISRWTGYTGVDRFVKSFNSAMSDLTTVEERVTRCRSNPTPKDAMFLADYFSDSQEYLAARDYLRLLQSLYGKSLDFSYRFFTSTAEAVWRDLLPFDSLTVAADTILAKRSTNSYNVGNMAQIIANVARRTGHTDRLEPYLKAGIEESSRRTDSAGMALNQDLLADYALHTMEDTTQALKVKKRALGPDWERDPARCFQFGEWCFRRNINLSEAEHYVRLATDKATGDKFRASHLRVLAEICYAEGKIDDALKLADQALALDPSAVWFEKKLREWQESQ